MVVADRTVTAQTPHDGEVPQSEVRTSLVIRVAGEAGEGIKKPGELLIQAAARAGFEVLTDFAPPSSIRKPLRSTFRNSFPTVSSSTIPKA